MHKNSAKRWNDRLIQADTFLRIWWSDPLQIVVLEILKTRRFRMRMFYYLRRRSWGGFDPDVCLCVRVSVSRFTAKVIDRCRWNLVLLLGLREEPIDFWWWSVPDTDSGSLFHFHQQCRIGHFGRFISISHTVTGRFLRNLAKWLMPTREWIHHILGAIRHARILINPKFRIWILLKATKVQGVRCTWRWCSYALL